MAKAEWVIRVVTGKVGRFDKQCEKGPLIEMLRHANMVEVHRQDDTGMCFDFLCPKGLDSKAWSEAESSRMRTMGANAVSAPRMAPGGGEVVEQFAPTLGDIYEGLINGLSWAPRDRRFSMVKSLIRALQIQFFSEVLYADMPDEAERETARVLVDAEGG